MNKSPVTARGEWLAICLTALGPTVAMLIYTHGPQSIDWIRLIYFGSKILLFSFPIIWWLYFEAGGVQYATRHPALVAPRGLKPAARFDIPTGLASGMVIGLFIWAAYWFYFHGAIDVKVLEQKVKAFGAYDHYVIYTMFLAVANSGLEEYYWRWFVFGRLKAKIGFYGAMVLSSLAFASHHFVVLQEFLNDSLLAALFSFGVAVGGAIWAYHYHRTGRLWGVWVSHFIVDAAALSVGYHLLFEGQSEFFPSLMLGARM